MQLVIHRSFLDSLEELSKSDRRRTVALLDKIREDPTAAGLRQHHVMNGFTSLSPSMSIRIIAQNVGKKLILLHVDQHDDAYKWAERHNLLSDMASGTFEIVGSSRCPTDEEPPGDAGRSYGKEILARLAGCGVPDYIARTFGHCSSEDDLLAKLETMSPEWQEAIIAIATGTTEQLRIPREPSSLVKVLSGDEQLSDALHLSVAKWRMFLHPKQQSAVNASSGRVTCIVGGPGTGKSVVCANRAVHLSKSLAYDEVVAVFTYSINLVADMRDHITHLAPEQKYFDRPIWVLPCQNVSEQQDPDCRTPVMIESGSVVLKHGRSRLKVRHIIVDEFQDSPVWFVEWLRRVTNMTDCETISVAMDANQSIFRIGHVEEIRQFLNGAKVQNLSYCYRMTNSLLENSFGVLSRYAATYSDVVDVGVGFHMPLAVLSGPRVAYQNARDTEDLLARTRIALRRLVDRYGEDRALVVIHTQYWNPHFAKSGKTDPLAEAMKNDPEVGKYYRFAASTKGKEYFAGVVVIPRDFMARDNGPANVMRLNTLYVALTRVRDELVVVYDDNAPAKAFLPIE